VDPPRTSRAQWRRTGAPPATSSSSANGWASRIHGQNSSAESASSASNCSTVGTTLRTQARVTREAVQQQHRGAFARHLDRVGGLPHRHVAPHGRRSTTAGAPHLAATAEHFGATNPDERFELLLDIFVDGLARRARG
jgi:hypothetical protein